MLLWLKRAFSTNPKTRNVGEARPLSWPTDYLSPFDPLFARKRDTILLWARCRAEGRSFDQLVRGRGWSPATAYRLRDEAATEIARQINAAIIDARQAMGLHPTDDTLDTERTALGSQVNRTLSVPERDT